MIRTDEVRNREKIMKEKKQPFCTEKPNILTVAAYLAISSEEAGNEPEILKKEYRELPGAVKEAGYEKVDLTSWELRRIGTEE